MIKLINANDKGRLFIVGDIHGDYDLLMEFIKWAKLKDNDLLVSVGDLIDRGDKNIQTLTHFLFADNCLAVQGNHEDMMIKSLVENSRLDDMTWMMNGGEWALNQDTHFLKGVAKKVAELPVFLDIEFGEARIAVSHAEMPVTGRKELLEAIEEGEEVDAAKITKLALWGRRQVKAPVGRGILGYDFVVHGHTPTQNILEEPVPIQKANQHWIDTGSVFAGGRLTFMEIEKDATFEYHQFWKDTDGELCII